MILIECTIPKTLTKHPVCITLCIERCVVRTNIVLNDALVEEAFKYSVDIRTKKELVETALKEYVQNRKIKDLRELKGKIVFSEDYDYKKMRLKK